ncbi:hypothetical protein [Mycoplana dimorpha]|uniref:Uncharacterized protein n=1 Tax=Mycoplana dimorpha TaxID=28320 RepID=A0A2T5BEB1_MYCDI|nr:hypothetical protein [Mycoplana dimorpha]PTM97344.1 hypothetical protein C7449_102214 [Mycoplana dimorpha]
MKKSSGFDPGGSAGLASALRRFPTQSAEIQNLIGRNETFRGLCDDLAAAEQALLSVDQLPDAVRESRRIEFENLVDSLAGELEHALSQIKVVSLWRRH